MKESKTIYSPARITLYLDIVEKLPNNYHKLDVIKQTIDLYDEIKIKESDKLDVICNPFLESEENIIYTVTEAFKKEYSIKENVEITVDKRIPVGAGLAGGSSNAAYTLMGLANFWGKHIEKEELIELVEKNKIGKDVPYFFYGGTWHDTEVNSDFLIRLCPLPKVYVILAMPDIKIFSKDAYPLYDSLNCEKNRKSDLSSMIKAIWNEDIYKVANNLHNDFEIILEKEEYKGIKKLKDILSKNGALASKACLTGSGSCVFGLYDNKNNAENIRENLKEYAHEIYLTETVSEEELYYKNEWIFK